MGPLWVRKLKAIVSSKRSQNLLLLFFVDCETFLKVELDARARSSGSRLV